MRANQRIYWTTLIYMFSVTEFDSKGTISEVRVHSRAKFWHRGYGSIAKCRFSTMSSKFFDHHGKAKNNSSVLKLRTKYFSGKCDFFFAQIIIYHMLTTGKNMLGIWTKCCTTVGSKMGTQTKKYPKKHRCFFLQKAKSVMNWCLVARKTSGRLSRGCLVENQGVLWSIRIFGHASIHTFPGISKNLPENVSIFCQNDQLMSAVSEKPNITGGIWMKCCTVAKSMGRDRPIDAFPYYCPGARRGNVFVATWLLRPRPRSSSTSNPSLPLAHLLTMNC